MSTVELSDQHTRLLGILTLLASLAVFLVWAGTLTYDPQ